jgi:RNA recognition motif-containing protein
MDLNMPRDKDTGKTKGFGFLMYEDQRSTILAVDNLNGSKVLEKTLRVDHVKNYKQPKVKNEDGEWVDPEEQSFNAKPQMIEGTSSLNLVSIPLIIHRIPRCCSRIRFISFHRSVYRPGRSYEGLFDRAEEGSKGTKESQEV